MSQNAMFDMFKYKTTTTDTSTDTPVSNCRSLRKLKLQLEKNKKKTIDCLMNSTDSLQVNSRINILIGALTCEERSKFLKLFA